ncbi:MAG: hypothetical protein KKA19_02845 [Candidatus Margulisbacteria bacterium]|nr:hypothetical protein [Candidatus Margulisiibacteriota bacterium]
MLKKLNWRIIFGFVLILLSISFYLFHYFIFRDTHHIFLYLIGDIAFLFLDVFIVMLVLEGVLAYREKKSIKNKLNMVIGTFFSEAGTSLLKECSGADSANDILRKQLQINADWTEKQFIEAQRFVDVHQGSIDSRKFNLIKIKDFLISKQSFMLSLLENPNLLEHESFTNLLWAVFHLTEELASRTDLAKLPDTDHKHLSGDVNRVYLQLIKQWIEYMKHLKTAYPYLFSLAVRKNPFDINASVVVKQ